jgi:hypothetical protein
MKKLALNMGTLFLTIGLCLISFNSNSQDIKLTRQEQKEARRAELVANYQVLDNLLERKSFVLEADFLSNQYGNRIPVTSLLNFIKVDSSNVVLQTGSNNNLGYNGVGGVTAEGSINNWNIVKDFKHLSYNLRFSLVTNIGIYDVFITISADNRAQATITGLTRGKLIYDGRLETIANSRIFKGQNTR